MIKVEIFFNEVRHNCFGGRLSQGQVDGLGHILKGCARHNVTDLRWMAYILATAFHETGRRMQPVREGFASTDEGAIRAVTRLFKRGRISRNYALRSKRTGQSYFGRGYVQLTWEENYARLGKKLDIDLLNQPSLALDPVVSTDILIRGCVEGLYTPGHDLKRYFNEKLTAPVGARRIVNGKDKASLIAGYYRNFMKSLEPAHMKIETIEPVSVEVEPPKIDDIYRTIREGDSGVSVATLQMLLYKHSYPTKITSIFDDFTERCVLQFQHEKELLADGIVGPRTWEALKL